jgi:hypothetical protein
LRNWIAEAALHLAPGALGDRLDAFGPNLKRIKKEKGADWHQKIRLTSSN